MDPSHGGPVAAGLDLGGRVNPAPHAATVALIASGIIDRKVRFGVLDESDFTAYVIPGTEGKTFFRRTQEDAVSEAWALIQLAEELRPNMEPTKSEQGRQNSNTGRDRR